MVLAQRGHLPARVWPDPNLPTHPSASLRISPRGDGSVQGRTLMGYSLCSAAGVLAAQETAHLRVSKAPQ